MIKESVKAMTDQEVISKLQEIGFEIYMKPMVVMKTNGNIELEDARKVLSKFQK